MPDTQTAWVVLARLLRPQGRKGELLAEMFTDFPDRFAPGSEVFLAPEDYDGPPSGVLPRRIASFWLPQGRNEGRVVLHFEGTDSIEGAERLSGLEVIVPESGRLALTDDSIYVDSLVGCAVYDGEVFVGTIREVQFMTSPDGRRRLDEAAPLLVVERAEGEALIPFAKDLLIAADVAQRTVKMKLPEGLLDLNLEKAPGDQKRNARPNDTIG